VSTITVGIKDELTMRRVETILSVVLPLVVLAMASAVI